MWRLVLVVCVTVTIAAVCSGCGHTQTCRVGLISFGDLEGKTIPEAPAGPILQGSSGARPFATLYCLSDAARDALKRTGYDTLVDVEVVTRTGLSVPSNKITVKGKGVDSGKLAQEGGGR